MTEKYEPERHAHSPEDDARMAAVIEAAKETSGPAPGSAGAKHLKRARDKVRSLLLEATTIPQLRLDQDLTDADLERISLDYLSDEKLPRAVKAEVARAIKEVLTQYVNGDQSKARHLAHERAAGLGVSLAKDASWSGDEEDDNFDADAFLQTQQRGIYGT